MNIVVDLYSPAFRDTLVNSILVSSAACLSIFALARHWRIMSWLLLEKEFRAHCTSLDAPWLSGAVSGADWTPWLFEQCSIMFCSTFDHYMSAHMIIWRRDAKLDILDHFGMILDALGMAVFLTVWLNRTNGSGMDWEALSYTISNAMECNTVSFLQFSSAKWRLSRRLPLLRVTCP